MRKNTVTIMTCPDCGRENVEVIDAYGICKQCKQRKTNAYYRNKEYIPYINLPKKQKEKIDILQNGQKKRRHEEPEDLTTIPAPKMPEEIENYYEVKAVQNPAIAHVVEKSETPLAKDTTINLEDLISILKENGCKISEEDLKELLEVLSATDKLKDMIMTVTKDNNQQIIWDLDQILNVVERKLQHVWEYNGFKEEDDIKFKEFLKWRRTLKGAMFFWKKLYQSNTLIEMQKAWDAYTQDPSEKIVLAGDKNRTESKMKRYQITTETISTILNTRREFTRVFYATTEQAAYDIFVKWLSDRQLHENKSKTKIVEL